MTAPLIFKQWGAGYWQALFRVPLPPLQKGLSWGFERRAARQRNGGPMQRAAVLQGLRGICEGKKDDDLNNEIAIHASKKKESHLKLSYRPDLKLKARTLRSDMTDAEKLLWFHLRRKQMQGITFYRQRPIAQFIVDFFAPAIHLAIEVDGGQHFEPAGLGTDAKRTGFLGALEIEVIRFNNLQVLKETSLVLEEIHRVVQRRKSPSVPLLQRGKCIAKG